MGSFAATPPPKTPPPPPPTTKTQTWNYLSLTQHSFQGCKISNKIFFKHGNLNNELVMCWITSFYLLRCFLCQISPSRWKPLFVKFLVRESVLSKSHSGTIIAPPTSPAPSISTEKKKKEKKTSLTTVCKFLERKQRAYNFSVLSTIQMSS